MPDLYAIKYKGEWYIAKLTLIDRYNATLDPLSEEPIWIDNSSTAFLCKWNEPTDVVRLP